MGVTYKLKQEVIDHIIQKKKQDPSLSCRKLVSLLQEELHVEVSKSSVNAVIKEFDLSNPVGRQSAKAAKNFFIPAEKKQQLLAQVVPFLPAVTPVTKESIPEPVLIEDPPEPVPEVAVIPSLPEAVEPVLEVEEVHLCPDLLMPPPQEQKQVLEAQIDWSDSGGVLVEGMGFSLIRALMQDVLRRPVLGRVMAHMAGMEEDASELLEAGLFLKIMGCSSMISLQDDVLQRLAAIWVTDQKKVESCLAHFLGKDISFGALAVALEVELGLAFVKEAFFKCVADTGRHFYLSTELDRLLSGADEASACSVFKAVEAAVDRFVTGNKPFIFDLPQGLTAESRDLLLFLDGATADKLDKIELWSDHSESMWEYIIKVGHKCHFIANIYYEMEQFKSSNDPASSVLQDAYKLKEGVYHQDQGSNFRAILVERSASDEKIVLLTNTAQKDLTKEQVFEKYLENKGFMIDPLQKRDDIRGQSFSGSGNIFKQRVCVEKGPDLITMLGHVFEVFEAYACHVLGASSLTLENFQRICDASGRIRHEKDLIHVRFEVEVAFSWLTELKAVVDRANACCMRDYLGRKFCFSVMVPADK